MENNFHAYRSLTSDQATKAFVTQRIFAKSNVHDAISQAPA
jgi:hypothetical protein